MNKCFHLLYYLGRTFLGEGKLLFKNHELEILKYFFMYNATLCE